MVAVEKEKQKLNKYIINTNYKEVEETRLDHHLDIEDRGKKNHRTAPRFLAVVTTTIETSLRWRTKVRKRRTSL